MTGLKPELGRALESMDVLNRWVRKTGCSRPRKAVYWLKGRYAIRDAVMAGLIPTMRYVSATVKCNRCRNGTYISWDGEPKGKCYHCDGKGVATLKFVETNIGGQFVWHTPLDYSSWQGWPMNDLTPEPVTNWEPGREGIDLPIEEAARHLNIVEEYWTVWLTDKPYGHGWDEYDSTRYYHFNYALLVDPLSALRADKCWHCQAPKAINCVTTLPPGLEVSWPTCGLCSKLPNIWELLKQQPPPPLGPELQKWAERHMHAFADIWKMRWNNDASEWQMNRIRRD